MANNKLTEIAVKDHSYYNNSNNIDIEDLLLENIELTKII